MAALLPTSLNLVAQMQAAKTLTFGSLGLASLIMGAYVLSTGLRHPGAQGNIEAYPEFGLGPDRSSSVSKKWTISMGVAFIAFGVLTEAVALYTSGAVPGFAPAPLRLG